MIYSIQNRKNAKLENYILGGSLAVGGVLAIVLIVYFPEETWILLGAALIKDALMYFVFCYILAMSMLRLFFLANKNIRFLIKNLPWLLTASVFIPKITGTDYSHLVYTEGYCGTAYYPELVKFIFDKRLLRILEQLGITQTSIWIITTVLTVVVATGILDIGFKYRFLERFGIYSLLLVLTPPFWILISNPSYMTWLLIVFLYSCTTWNTTAANYLAMLSPLLGGIPGVLLFLVQRRKELHNPLIALLGIGGLLISPSVQIIAGSSQNTEYLEFVSSQSVAYILNSPEYKFYNYLPPRSLTDIIQIPNLSESDYEIPILSREQKFLENNALPRIRTTNSTTSKTRRGAEFFGATIKLYLDYPRVFLQSRNTLYNQTTFSHYPFYANFKGIQEETHPNLPEPFRLYSGIPKGRFLIVPHSILDLVFSARSYTLLSFLIVILWLFSKSKPFPEIVIVSWPLALMTYLVAPFNDILPYAVVASLHLILLLEITQSWRVEYVRRHESKKLSG